MRKCCEKCATQQGRRHARAKARLEMTIPEKPFDVIIVGGGSAGSVLAARLSEDAGREVLLIEAGRDIRAGETPTEVLSPYAGLAYFNPGLTYTNIKVQFAAARGNALPTRPLAPYSQGRAMGGGSAVNGLGANRGAPGDYDEWEALGLKGWGWRDVLPHFRKLERDLEFDSDLHGKDGPLPIRRVPETWRSGFVRAALASLADRSIPELPDQNGVWEDGVFAQKVNLDEQMKRVPTSLGWLTPEVRQRPNLTIMTQVHVARILMEGTRAAGVVLDLGLQHVPVKAREVIVAAGAINTPALLMRSGIGPAAHLQERGVTPIVHLPGVGQNLMEHPYAGIAFYLPRHARMRSDDHHHIPAIWRFSSGHDGCPTGDMHMGFMGRSAWHGIGKRMGALAFWVNKSFSRGSVELDRDVDAPPTVHMNLLSDERDRIRLKQAFHLAAELAASITSTGAAGPSQPARMSDRARKFGAPTTRNRWLTGLAGAAVDLCGPFAATLMRRLTAEGPSVSELLADDAALDQYLDESVIGVWHASGTCRMGLANDPLAVTDAAGQVYRTQGLRVCDASLFPTIPCANLNVPVIMAAEKIADGMRR
jgi:5-(hydroxymethyl)furfural/furfural oxidase